MKMHINIVDDTPPTLALECVKQVVEMGRLSGKGKRYCYAAIFDTHEGEIWVTATPYRKSDCFVVYKMKNHECKDLTNKNGND